LDSADSRQGSDGKDEYSYVSSDLSFFVTKEDNGVSCDCDATWDSVQTQYTNKASVVLTVLGEIFFLFFCNFERYTMCCMRKK
jgi:hypothetical protein